MRPETFPPPDTLPCPFPTFSGQPGAHGFQNELIILSHFSTRYHDRQIRAAVERRFPPSLASRVHLWM